MGELKIKADGTWKPISTVSVREGGIFQKAKDVFLRNAGAWVKVWSAIIQFPHRNLINTALPIVHIPEANANPVQILEETSEYYLIKAVNRAVIGFDINVENSSELNRYNSFVIPVEIVDSNNIVAKLQARIFNADGRYGGLYTTVGKGPSKKYMIGVSYWTEARQIHIASEDAFNDIPGETTFRLYKAAEFTMTLMNYYNFYHVTASGGQVFVESDWYDTGYHIAVRTIGDNNGVSFKLENMTPGATYTLHFSAEILSASPNKQQKLRVSLEDDYESQRIVFISNLIITTSQIGVIQNFSVDFIAPNSQFLYLNVTEMEGGETSWRIHKAGTKVVYKNP